MKKTNKILATVLVLVMAVSFAACKKDSATKLSLGQAAQTDIAEITVNKAALGYYVENASYSASTDIVSDFETAYLPIDNAGSTDLSASKGNTLVCIDFTLKNTDRNMINLASDKIMSFTITQGKNTAEVLGYNLDSGNDLQKPDFAYSIYSTDGGNTFYKQQDKNMYIDNVLSYNIRVVGIANFDADLTAPFELTVKIKNSSDKTEEFSYDITP